jgi:type II pantothenate kinase
VSPPLELGLDVGATLTKIARVSSSEKSLPDFERMPSEDLEAVAAHLNALDPVRVGITGGGAIRLASMLTREALRASEFDAWGAGAIRLLRNIPDGPALDGRFLLVSLGTGTSILLVDRGKTTRVGGTPLGGGAVVGLGGVLTGAGFEELCALAERGDSAAVDLRVSDIYGPDEIPLAADLTAASFGKLARDPRSQRTHELGERDRADRAASLMRLVGENVGLICGCLAAATGARHVVYGGSTLLANDSLARVLADVAKMFGLQSCLLPHGSFAGALGALELARVGEERLA